MVNNLNVQGNMRNQCRRRQRTVLRWRGKHKKKKNLFDFNGFRWFRFIKVNITYKFIFF